MLRNEGEKLLKAVLLWKCSAFCKDGALAFTTGNSFESFEEFEASKIKEFEIIFNQF